MTPRNAQKALLGILKGFLRLGQRSADPVGASNGDIWTTKHGVRCRVDGKYTQADGGFSRRRMVYGNIRGLR